MREDRFSTGVTEADRLQNALETGDAAAYSAALEGRPPAERELVVSRSVRFVERNVSFRRVAARALDAVVTDAQGMPALEERLHRAAVAALGEAEGELLLWPMWFAPMRARGAGRPRPVVSALAAESRPASGPSGYASSTIGA